jgi:hypothetical protein
LHETNYQRNYQPIEERVLQQWRSLMLEQLTTANSRQRRSLYQLGAPLRLEIRPVADLKPTEVRILCRVGQPTAGSSSASEPGMPITRPKAATTPCLETISGGKRWLLRTATVTIGRDQHCNIYLDMPAVQELRLISGEHAYLRLVGGRYFVYDGSPDGKTSLNGTFVNRMPVPLGGCALDDGDEIILASLDPGDPHPDARGVVALRFREACA